ncbi:MAG TPA: TolC family protein, partial [Gemmatimonadaceae bacterium]|nr:TolC family protein [Gemmatimonadaceae bacterium]
ADEVRLSAAQADIAEAQFDIARATLLPQLRINSSYSRTFESARSNAVSAVFNQPNTYSVNANVSQTLFQGGRLVATARAASALAEASRLNAEERKALYTVELQRAYLGALLAERLAELQQTNLQLASARLTQVQQFHTAGRAAQYDVLRAKVERANIEPLTIQAQNDRDLFHLELKRLLNLPVDQPLALTTQVDPQAAQSIVASFEDSVVVPQRPALRAAELTARSRRLALSAARSEFMPTITAFFQTGFQAFPPPGFGFPATRGSLNADSCPAGSVAGRVCQNGGWFEDRNMGIQFSWPLFDGLRAKSALELARAQTRIAELELRLEREQVAVEVARARAELQRARAIFDARRETSAEANEAFRLASLRFSRGLSTQLEVSDAQLALLTAEGSTARATYDLFLATAELARALGRPIPMPLTSAAARRTDN